MAHSRFGGSSGWYLTEGGRVEDEHRLSRELDLTGVREIVTVTHQRFLPLNDRFGKSCTDWQIRPTSRDPMTSNDHTEWGWDEHVFRTQDALGPQLTAVIDPLAGALRRFDGYATRFSAALAKVNAAQPRWIDAPDVDSCHTVWIQLPEDLLATLGIPRGTDG